MQQAVLILGIIVNSWHCFGVCGNMLQKSS